ncbi:MAG: c-type cytochrome, partial [Ignavibacteriales bacterium]|nr:c-type cytochrome [Ignavibacteriales bacterium]
LFCAEYCGTSHASMRGRVVVMKQEEFERWLAGGTQEEPMISKGEQLFARFGCLTCHSQVSQERGPSLHGLFGSTVRLADGSTVTADERYIRESIVSPNAALVAGYKPLMPTYAQQISQEQLFQIIEYIKSLGGPQVAAARRSP